MSSKLLPSKSISIMLYWPSVVKACIYLKLKVTFGIPFTSPNVWMNLYIFASKWSWGNFVVASSSFAANFYEGFDLFYAKNIYPNAPVPSFFNSRKFLHTMSSKNIFHLTCFFLWHQYLSYSDYFKYKPLQFRKLVL